MPREKTKMPPVLDITKIGKEEKKAMDANNAYVADKYNKFMQMYTVWNQAMPLLGGRTPLQFWNDSVRDYAVLAAEMDDPNDPVESYQSTISRDKTNTLYANLASKFFYPTCVAQNGEQSIDKTMARVGDATLYWAYKQDGWPSESGQQKNARIVHKCTVEGTAYTLDVVTEDGLDSQLVPNEEVYYPNLWQPNIQLQKRVYRARLNMTIGEAEEEWGDNENWDKVEINEGWTEMFQVQYPELKGIFDGIVQSDKVSVLYIWERATQKELKELKSKGKVYKNAKRAWFYNVIVNNVAMFPLDNVCPYKSGILPISKMIFEPMAKTEFALGNSVPNKCQEDKRWKDAWKTNLRWRGKLAGMPPQLVIGGHLNGEEVMLPSVFTSLPKDVDVKQVPGIQPISTADITLMQMTDAEIDRSTVEPMPTGDSTARTAMIRQANADQMLAPFSQQLAFFAASRSFHVLMALFQYLPKSAIRKIAVPDQTLEDGLTGTFEVIFKEPNDVLATEVDSKLFREQSSQIKEAGFKVNSDDLRRLLHSFKLKGKAENSRQGGNPVDTIYVSPSYLQDIKFYLFADAGDALQDKDAMAQAQFAQDLPLMLAHPESLVPNEVWREFIKKRGYNERLLAKNAPQPQQEMGQPRQGGQPGEAIQTRSGLTPPPSTPNEAANKAALATTGAPIGRLPGV